MSKAHSEDNPKQIVAQNRKARYDYHFLETFQVGVVLQGTEVKSLRQGKANLQDSHASINNGEIFLYDCHISPYEQGNVFNHDPKRRRKLLMHKSEIVRLFGKVQQKGYTLVPLRIYFTRGKAKLDIALAQGKKQFDKREDIKRRDMDREVRRAELR
ncbi:MAG: SsrA-binding protein SmpB [Candidatus Hinthialibacter antarcticus]|nr:SsrA-binding protein SmpB [Candidatus Hinthialibacter antarcticus]